jgi:hypothetical protein
VKRVSTWIAIAIVALLVWGFVIPLVDIHFRLARGDRVKKALIAAVEERYPHLRCSGGNGFLGPSAHIMVKGTADKDERLRVRELLRTEKAKMDSEIEAWLEFDVMDRDVDGTTENGLKI